MSVVTKQISLQTTGETDMIDITDQVVEALDAAGLRNGVVTIFISGATAAITTIEYEPGLLKDFPDMLERIAPKTIEYEHGRKWHDENGHSHVRASLLGPSLTIPFSNGKLFLGTWQQIVFVELDVHQRSRNLVLQIVGE